MATWTRDQHRAREECLDALRSLAPREAEEIAKAVWELAKASRVEYELNMS